MKNFEQVFSCSVIKWSVVAAVNYLLVAELQLTVEK